MDRFESSAATATSRAHAMPSGSGARQRRHVLIPSELVTAEIAQPDGSRQTVQADLINVSDGGCCLVLPCSLALQRGASGVMVRPAGEGQAQNRQPFVMRWFQDLGDMMEIGVQYLPA